MEFSKQTRAWILLVFILLGSGCMQVVISYSGGCKLWVAVLGGIGAGATAVVTALMKSPNDPTHKENENT